MTSRPEISPDKLAVINDYMTRSSVLTELQLSHLAIAEGFVRKNKQEQMQRIVDQAIMGNLAALSGAIFDLLEKPGEAVFIQHPSNKSEAPLTAVGYDTSAKAYNVRVVVGENQPMWPFHNAAQLLVRTIPRVTRPQ